MLELLITWINTALVDSGHSRLLYYKETAGIGEVRVSTSEEILLNGFSLELNNENLRKQLGEQLIAMIAYNNFNLTKLWRD